MKKPSARMRELAAYLLFGVLTSLVSMISLQGLEWLLKPRWGDHTYLLSKWVSFVLALLFAFWVNKAFVFKTAWRPLRAVVREAVSFSAMRVVSFVLVEYVLLVVTFELIWPKAEPFFAPWWLGLGPPLSKIEPIDAYRFVTQWGVIGVLVTVLNYIFSKFFVFKKKKAGEAAQ
ncbi:MAG: GtrA family protein [Oscillospiraceae bacterium]|jgi:putative flippase GtrA|nr:GtrA family protein [Oscillospiraceae bacterium]